MDLNYRKMYGAYREVIEESSFLIPEEVPANERTAFHGAAAAAHKAGKSHFNFSGKKYPVTMKKDVAKAINSETQKEAADDQKAETEVDGDDESGSKKIECPKCEGAGCAHCDGKGYHMSKVENKKSAVAKSLAKASAPSQKGKDAVSLKKAPFDIPKESVEENAVVDEAKNCGCGKTPCETYGESAVKDFSKDHMMYDPKTGKGRMTKSYADHLDLMKKGWSHEQKEDTESNISELTQAQKQMKMKAQGGVQGRQDGGTSSDLKSLGFSHDHQGRGLKKTHKPGDNINYGIAQARKDDAKTGKISGLAHDKKMRKGDSKLGSNPTMQNLRRKHGKDMLGRKIAAESSTMPPAKGGKKTVRSADKRPVNVVVGGKTITRMEPVVKRSAAAYESTNENVSLTELKKGDTVMPNKGPHAGKPHTIIHDFGDGHYNIKPDGMTGSQIKYRMGAVKAKAADLKLHKESVNVTRENWIDVLNNKNLKEAEDAKTKVSKPTSPHHSDDATRDTYDKQLSTRKGEKDFVDMHNPETPEYADVDRVLPDTFANFTKDVKGPAAGVQWKNNGDNKVVKSG